MILNTVQNNIVLLIFNPALGTWEYFVSPVLRLLWAVRGGPVVSNEAIVRLIDNCCGVLAS